MAHASKRTISATGEISLTPYANGSAIDLSANENHLGPSHNAICAYHKAAKNLWHYPDTLEYDLKILLAQQFHINPDRIVCVASSEELRSILIRAYVKSGSELVLPAFGSQADVMSSRFPSATIVRARSDGDNLSVEGMLASLSPRTSAIFIMSPNEMTGSYLRCNDLHRLLSAIPAKVPVILDGEYADYVRDREFTDGLSLAEEFENLIVMRSFSKIYGLAAMGVAWCYASKPAIERIDPLRASHSISGPALAAAIGSLEDGHSERCASHNARWKENFVLSLSALSIEVLQGGGNFVVMKLATADAAEMIFDRLLMSGIRTRRLADCGLPSYLRLTIGTSDENEAVLGVLRVIMAN